MRRSIFCAAIATSVLITLCPASVQADTINNRVRKLESKTDYYKKVNKVYRKSKSRAATSTDVTTTSGDCRAILTEVNPGLTSGGNLYVWVKAKVTYSGSPEAIDAGFAVDGIAEKQVPYPVSQASGVLDIKYSEARFYVPAGSKFAFYASRNPYNKDGPCIESLEFEMKTTFIAVDEPSFD